MPRCKPKVAQQAGVSTEGPGVEGGLQAPPPSRIDPLWLLRFKAYCWYCNREYRRLRRMDQLVMFR